MCSHDDAYDRSEHPHADKQVVRDMFQRPPPWDGGATETNADFNGIPAQLQWHFTAIIEAMRAPPYVGIGDFVAQKL